MMSLCNYLIPSLLVFFFNDTATTEIYTQFITRFNWEQGAAFGFLLLALYTALVILGLRVSGQRFGDVMRRT
jgi:spermidine/putrescine transport system permease protein